MTPTIPDVSICCETTAEYPRFYPRQIVTADDLTLDQRFSREKARRHSRFLHGWGVVCGATLDYTTKPWMIKVRAGYVITPCGDEIVICKDVCFDLRDRCITAPPAGQDPCGDVWQPPAAAQGAITVFVAIEFSQTQTRPVRVKSAGCGCSDNQCESSRWKDGYRICILDTLPESHQGDPNPVPVTAGDPPQCPPVIVDPWVVLGAVTVQTDGTVSTIVYSNCRRQMVSFAKSWWRPADPPVNTPPHA
jgi:hypothetical protein